ncbi:S-layer homology domain-containing protein [Cohnella sp. GCM10027633]|uniref:S-layer homology domain-containing protein n=1 Tax=unclassified Cohnella TaxID=2636738 RepID=UPI0036274738
MKRMTKLSLLLIVAGLLLLGSNAYADPVGGAANLTLQAEVEASTGVATLSGAHAGGAGKRVSLLVADSAGKLVCVDQTTSGAEGAYAFSCRLPAGGYGDYEAKVGGEESSAVSLEFEYASPSGGGDPGGSDGGSGGGSSGNVGNAEAPDADVVLKPTPSGRTASAVLSLDAAKHELPEGASGPKKPLRIEVAKTEGVDSVSLKLPADLFKPEWRDRLSEVRIETQFGVVSIKPNAIPGLKDAAGEVVFTIGPANAGAGLTAYAFTLSVDGRPVSDFNGNRAVRVTIPFDKEAGDRPETIVVYYVSDDGSLTLVGDGHYDEAAGAVTFYAKHFSVYAAATVGVEDFADVAATPWAKSAIAGLAARKVVNGTGEARFEPQRAVTRAEFVRMLALAFELKAEGKSSGFSDVPDGSWYEEAAAAAVKNGIATGYPDGTFGGVRTITRQEMAVMIARTLRASGIEPPADAVSGEPKDLARVAKFAKDDVLALYRAGIAQGDAAQRFNPGANSTRAEAAVMIYRLLMLP